MNVDSWAFMRLTERPAELLEPSGVLRRSRPLYVAAGNLLERPLRPLGRAIGSHLRGAPAPPDPQGTLPSSWLPLVILNLVVLVGAVLAFETFVCGSTAPGFTTWCLAAVLVVNPVTRSFFWSPHTQTLNLLTPLLALWIAWRTLQGRFAAIGTCAGLGFALGLGMLAYGNFPIALASYAIALAVAGAGEGAARVLGRVVSTGVGFALPVIGWVVYVTWRIGRFETGELQKAQFLWVLDALRLPGADALDQILGYFMVYASTWGRVLWFPVSLLVGIMLARAATDGRPVTPKLDHPRLLAIGIVIAITMAFQALVGYYADRLSWSLAPPVLAAAGVLARPIDQRMRGMRRLAVRSALAAAVAAWIGVQAFGPWLPLPPWLPLVPGQQMLLDPRYSRAEEPLDSPRAVVAFRRPP